jgi:hypothetical protein
MRATGESHEDLPFILLTSRPDNRKGGKNILILLWVL